MMGRSCLDVATTTAMVSRATTARNRSTAGPSRAEAGELVSSMIDRYVQELPIPGH
jgi:hypothetical protein